MNELKYHWSNPRFAGLPWSIDQKTVKRGKMLRRKCIKKNFSLADVQNEIAMLRNEAPSFRWSFKLCGICQGFHVLRHVQ